MSSNICPSTRCQCLSLLAAVGWYWASLAPVHAQPQASASVVVAAHVVEETVAAEQISVGTVVPPRLATVGSAVSGRVVDRPIEEGDRVLANQTLTQLLTETINLEIQGAEAELDWRKEQLAELENGSRPEEIRQAEARMAAAAARRRFLDSRQERLQQLLRARSAAVTEEEVEEALSQALEAEQVYLEMKAAYDLTVEGPRREVIAQARAQVAMQEALVEKLLDQLGKHTVISRFDGYVVKTHTENGQWVNPGDPVAEVAALDEVDVVVQVVERYVEYITPGSIVRVEIPSIPDRIFEGRTITTVPQGDIRSRTFPVKIRVINEVGTDGPLIKSGMYARASLPVGTPQQATLVPKDAIVLGGPQPMVVVVRDASEAGETGTTAVVPVVLGVAKGKLIQVKGDVQPGQLVVVQGNERLRPGQSILVSRIETPQSNDGEPLATQALEAKR
jgi:RND family efflux transporter MFP subunit